MCVIIGTGIGISILLSVPIRELNSMRSKRYTEEKLREAVASSFSYRQVLQKIGIVAVGGNYATLKRAIEKYGIDSSHFTSKGWSKGKTFGHKRSLEEYFLNSVFIGSHKLRTRLLKEKIFQHKCMSCKLEQWMNSLIPLELDHINGDNTDNSLINLRLLCPNCHALTSTYRGKKKKKVVPLVGFEPTL